MCRSHRTRSTMRWLRQLLSLPERASTIAKFQFPVASHVIRDIQPEHHHTQLTLQGHLNRKPRNRATKLFAELRDTNGDTVQLVFQDAVNATSEDCVSVTGTVLPKPGTDQWELHVDRYQVLNPANLDAARLDKLKHTSPKDLPPQFRYLQLRTKYFSEALKTRLKVTSTIRDILINDHDFTEVETPLLFKLTPEGAREFIVPTRLPSKFYALPQSPQQYKQILMSSGVYKYFQIARCFRDEDLRADRQPEFTQVDLEMAYVSDAAQVQTVVEDMVNAVWNKVKGAPTYRMNAQGLLEKVKPGDHFNKLTYRDALRQYGIDKPDLRSSLTFVDLSSQLRGLNPQFPVVEACVLKGVGKPLKNLTDAGNYSKRKPYVVRVQDDKWWQGLVDKAFTTTTEFDPETFTKLVGAEPGDVVAISTRADLSYENPTPLGKFRQLAIEAYPDQWRRQIVEDDGTIVDASADICVGAWVVEFPLFNPVEAEESDGEYPKYDFTRFTSTHHPFTMPRVDDYDLLAVDPLAVHGEHYDLVVNGVELGGGSRRIHDPALQQYVFENVLGINNYRDLFGHLLQALSMGCPPHAGLAIGLDRLCAMVIGLSLIRDVIAFPKNQSGVDPVVETPTPLPATTLANYHIDVVE